MTHPALAGSGALQPSFLVALGATFSLQVEFTITLFFVLLALAAWPYLEPLRVKP